MARRVTLRLSSSFRGKRVLVTGHTGFKGSWLCMWLARLGAQVSGYALAPPTDPAMFDICGLDTLVPGVIADIRDRETLERHVAQFRPQVVFHLAAQPLVRLSYAIPAETLEVNAIGTANLLEAVRALQEPCAVVVVTSDKCYENKGWIWGYRENDALGGSDPYSMSKAVTELVVASWRESFFRAGNQVRLASARAGNVIGGGDWAQDRIVVDIVAAMVAGRPVELRNPQSTRPWQHVLEPLHGYLLLAHHLMEGTDPGIADAWNFGPRTHSVRPVRELADLTIAAWGSGEWKPAANANSVKEAAILSLNWDKAHHGLGWNPVWDLPQTVSRTVQWYKAFYGGSQKMREFTLSQIEDYASHLGA